MLLSNISVFLNVSKWVIAMVKCVPLLSMNVVNSSKLNSFKAFHPISASFHICSFQNFKIYFDLLLSIFKEQFQIIQLSVFFENRNKKYNSLASTNVSINPCVSFTLYNRVFLH